MNSCTRLLKFIIKSVDTESAKASAMRTQDSYSAVLPDETREKVRIYTLQCCQMKLVKK